MRRSAFLLIVVAFLLFACTTPAQESSSETVYEIGLIAPLSGDAAFIGEGLSGVTQVAVEDVNALWADDNKRLVVRYEDGMCNGREALSALQSLHDRYSITVISGGACSGETLGMAPYANDNQILLLSSGSTSPAIREAGEFVFRNYPSDDGVAIILSEQIAQQGFSRVALLSENTDYAQDLRDAFVSNLEQRGVEVVASENVLSSSRDFRTELTRIQQEQPTVLVLVPQTAPMSASMMRQVRELGLQAELFFPDLGVLFDALTDNRDLFVGVTTARYVVAAQDSEEYQDILARSSCTLEGYCAAQYDAIVLLADIIDSCGSVDALCVQQGLFDTQGRQGLAGELSFDENGEILGNFEIVRISEEAIELV
ncbi:MAG: ABC transporter substrate-binding protein [Candidatus Woesearchaeota archaeon]